MGVRRCILLAAVLLKVGHIYRLPITLRAVDRNMLFSLYLICCDSFSESNEGRRILADNIILASGQLRPISAFCKVDDQCPSGAYIQPVREERVSTSLAWELEVGLILDKVVYLTNKHL